MILSGHLDWIARTALQYRKDADEAADLAQDAMVRMWINRDKYNPSMAFRPWAKCVMRNLAITQATQRKTETCSIEACADPPSDVRADSAAIVSDILRETRDTARKAVGVESVVLYAQGYSYDEIAAMTGVGVGTVKSRISSGRKALAEALGC